MTVLFETKNYGCTVYENMPDHYDADAVNAYALRNDYSRYCIMTGPAKMPRLIDVKLPVSEPAGAQIERLNAAAEIVKEIMDRRKMTERRRIKSDLNRDNNAIMPAIIPAAVRAEDQPKLKYYPVDVLESMPEMPHLFLTAGNSKIGRILNLSIAVYHTCDVNAECRKSGLCYAMAGHYNHDSVLIRHSLNYLWLSRRNRYEIAAEIVMAIDAGFELFRPDTAGDLFSLEYAAALHIAARMRPGCKFGTYTKRAIFADMAADIYGTPHNLRIALSPWTRDDGTTVIPFSRYDRPKAYFIPAGMTPEDIAPHAIGCPNLIDGRHCDHCGICYGCSAADVYFKEHSTDRTKKARKGRE